MVCTQSGYVDVDDAKSGAVALEMLKEKSYRLIICDRIMEPMDGLALLKEVRALPGGSVIRLLMMSADAGDEGLMLIANSEVDDFIRKPFTAAILGPKLGNLLRKSI